MELKQDIEKEIIKLIISEYISTLYYIHLIVQLMYNKRRKQNIIRNELIFLERDVNISVKCKDIQEGRISQSD